jgi:NAD+ synthase
LDTKKVAEHITAWLSNYCDTAGLSGFIIGISGGVDSGLASTLCAMTGKKTILVSMPIRQTYDEYERAKNHIQDLESRFENISSFDIDLTQSFDQIEKDFPDNVAEHHLAMANTRARLRMSTLYAIGQVNGCLVCGTGNKVEDFGVGFYTKYGDGGVDISPIADLTKSNVWALATEVGVIKEIVSAKPTDGLWADGRSDEDQIGASYPELEWAMDYKGDGSLLSARKEEVLEIYRRLNRINKHKMDPIPVCLIPSEYK